MTTLKKQPLRYPTQPTFVDMTGTKVFRLTVVKLVNVKPVRYRCKCECGRIVYVTGTNLRTGNTKSCGCYRREMSRAKKGVPHLGERLNPEHMGYWTIHTMLKYHRGPAKNYRCEWCGNQAQTWAYIGTENTLIDPKLGFPYSENMDDYVPLCKSCHGKHDWKRNREN